MDSVDVHCGIPMHLYPVESFTCSSGRLPKYCLSNHISDLGGFQVLGIVDHACNIKVNMFEEQGSIVHASDDEHANGSSC